jgi:lysozyme
VDKLIKMLRHHEGVRHKPYKDTVGKLTIGVGRNLDDNGLSDDEIDYLLQNDINRCMSEAMTYDWFKDLNDARRAVVLSLLFNLGKPRYDKFVKHHEAMADGHMLVASRELLDSRWAKQVGRRANEMAKQLETGEWQ